MSNGDLSVLSATEFYIYGKNVHKIADCKQNGYTSL